MSSNEFEQTPALWDPPSFLAARSLNRINGISVNKVYYENYILASVISSYLNVRRLYFLSYLNLMNCFFAKISYY